MNRYIITISELLSKDIIIEAESKIQAIQKVKVFYNNGQIVLYPEECDINVKYEISEENIF